MAKNGRMHGRHGQPDQRHTARRALDGHRPRGTARHTATTEIIIPIGIRFEPPSRKRVNDPRYSLTVWSIRFRQQIPYFSMRASVSRLPLRASFSFT